MSGEFSLAMPFVTVQSKGGPHEDNAYTAGYEMGALDMRLRAAVALGTKPAEVCIRRESVLQCDLIAMRNGLVATVIPFEWGDEISDDNIAAAEGEWARVAFEWGTPPP